MFSTGSCSLLTPPSYKIQRNYPPSSLYVARAVWSETVPFDDFRANIPGNDSAKRRLEFLCFGVSFFLVGDLVNEFGVTRFATPIS
jgi:hypothetical protein